MRAPSVTKNGFSLIEAMLVMIVIGTAFLGFGFLYGNIDQQALKADLTILATKLAREKMEEVIQTKADSGYAAVTSSSAQAVTSGAWSFTRRVDVANVNPNDLTTTPPVDSNYKRVTVTVSWGTDAGSQVSLTTLLTNVVP